MARRKISRKIPPMKMLAMGGANMNLGMNTNQGFAHESYLGNTNYQQFATPESFLAGHMDRTASMGTAPGGFQPTYIANKRHWNQGATAADEGFLTPFNFGSAANKVKGLARQNAINAGKPMVENAASKVKESVNTFSSEIDPSDKSEFKNEVVNEVMNKVGGDEIAGSPQNKLEELYKPV